MGARAAFVGRERELAAACSVLDDDGSGVVLVSGEPGIGKTRLIGEVAARAETAGWNVERTAGSATGRSTPFTPFLHLQAPDAPPSQDPAEQLVRLRAELQMRAGDRPLLLVVDDAHLLDDASVLLLHQMATRDAIAIAIAAPSREPLSADLLGLVKDGHATQLGLEPLLRAECDQVVAGLLDGPVEETVNDEVWRVAQGNPLFVCELVQSACESAVLSRNGSWQLRGPLGASPLLREMIGRRLERLPEEPRSLLEDLAVAGTLPWPVIERLVPLSTVVELEVAGLVRSPPGFDVVDVGHPLYTEVIRELAPEARLHVARRRVAAALLGSDAMSASETTLVADLQLTSGGVDHDLLVRAAGFALDQFDPERALRYSSAALGLAEARPGSRLVHARALSASGRLIDAESEFLVLAELDLGDEWLVEVTSLHAQHRAFAVGDVPEALELLQARIDHNGASVRDPLRGLLGYIAFFAGRFDDALGASLPLVAIDPPPIDACQGPSTVWAIRGDPDQVLELWSRAMKGMQGSESGPTTHFGVANFVFNRLLALWQLGRAIEADDPLDALPRRFAYPTVGTEEHRLGLGAVQAFLRGHLDDADSRYEELGDRLLKIAAQAHTFNRAVRATTAAMRGNAVAAREHLADVEATPSPQRAGFDFWIARAGAWISTIEGDEQDGITRLLVVVEERAAELFHVTIGLHDVVRLGRPELVVDKLAAQAARDGATWWDGVCTDHARALDRSDGRILLDVAARFEAGGLDLHAAEALAQAAPLLEPGGQGVTALMRLARLLERCGQVRTPALATLPALPSTREREVARLAADGLSNRQIADRFGTSARTVGNQLQHVYDKLGVHTRDELTRLLDSS